MNVKELKKLLETMDDNAEVVITNICKPNVKSICWAEQNYAKAITSYAQTFLSMVQIGPNEDTKNLIKVCHLESF